jgi:hypothetical protein
MAQSGFTPIRLYFSSTPATVPLAADLAPGELALNNNDGKLFYEDSSGIVQVIATKASANDSVVGPASATDTAVACFDGTTGKLIQNSVVTVSLGGLISAFSLTSLNDISVTGMTIGKGPGALSNVAIGTSALVNNVSGGNSVAIGDNALGSNTTGSYNTALGDGALNLNSTNSNNTAIGRSALGASTSDNNTAIGYTAGQSITTGANNVCLGYQSGTDALVTITTSSNNVVLGNNSTTSLYCKTATITTSDLRDKTNVRPVTLGLDFVNQINPIAYQFKVSREDDTPSSRTYLGWAAQDVLANQGIENIVDQQDPEHLKMAGMDMVAVLWKSVQELSAKVAELEAKLNAK